MANEEHLKIVREGAEAWNDWRRENPDVLPNLVNADLRGVDLSGANLAVVNLSGADLRGANLDEANLGGANLEGADLTSATLGRAHVQGANLSAADLRRTDLILANLTSSRLSGAVVDETFLRETILADVDLSDVLGLDQVDHGGESIVDQRTLRKSTPLPEPFLRGIGFSDEYIAYIPTLFGGNAINLYSCFISYSSSDRDFAKRLHDSLQGRGVRCWLDEHQILPGEDIRTEIDLGIRVWDKVLLCCSKTSLTESNWVDDEIEKALQKEQKLRKDTGKKLGALIPLNLDNHLFSDDYQSGVKSEIIRRNAADFTKWKDHDAFEAALEKVLRALRLDGGKPPAPEPKLKRRGS